LLRLSLQAIVDGEREGRLKRFELTSRSTMPTLEDGDMSSLSEAKHHRERGARIRPCSSWLM
jgi:hypothetical protein